MTAHLTAALDDLDAHGSACRHRRFQCPREGDVPRDPTIGDVVPYLSPKHKKHAGGVEQTEQPDVAPVDHDDEDDEYAMWLVVVTALRDAFPYIDIEEINRFEPLEDEIDLTAEDFTQVMASVEEQTGLVVPEEDYPLLATLDGLEQYLKMRVASPA